MPTQVQDVFWDAFSDEVEKVAMSGKAKAGLVGALGLAAFAPIGFSGFARTIEAAVPEGTPLPPIDHRQPCPYKRRG